MPDISTTLMERTPKYGSFKDNAELSQALLDLVLCSPGAENLEPLHKEAFYRVFMKVGRLVNGDPNDIDGWHDIQGYAKLVEMEILNGS